MGRTRRKRKRNHASVTSENDDFINLQKWMRLKKCNLQMRCFPETGRGLRNKKKTISVGDELVSLPLHLLITPKTICDLFSQSDTSKLSPQLVLTIFLMYESHLSEKSAYWPYLKLLPSNYSTLFFCEKREIEFLPCFMQLHVLNKHQELEQEFETMIVMFSLKSCPHCGLQLEKLFSFSLFTWAWFTVNTRSVYYKDKEYYGLALAPLLDMFNHSPEAEIEMLIDHEQKVYTLKSLKEYKRKEQIFIKYGPHSNWKLLSEYGFVLENNPHDYIEFTFDEIIKAVKEYKAEYGAITDAKYKFIKKNNFDKNLTKNKEEFSWNMNALLYILVTTDEYFPCIYAKCCSNEFSKNEWNEMSLIMEILMKTKHDRLTHYLNKMETINQVSESFSSAKKLLQIYLSFLTQEKDC